MWSGRTATGSEGDLLEDEVRVTSPVIRVPTIRLASIRPLPVVCLDVLELCQSLHGI